MKKERRYKYMMKQQLFIETLERLEKSNTVYGLGMWGQPITEAIITSKSNQLPTWYKENKNADKIRPYANKGYFGFDCVCMIKSILWGFSFNLNASNGGAKYASNGVPDINADTLITKCTDVSTDFTKIVPGAVVWIKGHVGVYVGNGQVIECTADWSRRVLRSHLGNLNYKGDYVRKWSKWGKLPWIEYTDLSTPSTSTSSSNSSEYYAKYTGSSSSLDEIFKAISVPSEYIKDKSGETYDVRKPVAEANGIPCYIGSSEQNTLLKNLAKNGKLKKVKTASSTTTVTPAPAPTTPSLRKLQDGDVIQLVSNATYHNGASIPSWVFKKTLYFRGKDSGKDTVKFSTVQTGAVTGRINPSSIVGYGSTITF